MASKNMTFTENDAEVTITKERNEVMIVMPFQGARDNRIVVISRGGPNVDPQIVFDTAKRDVLQAAAWVASGSNFDANGTPVFRSTDDVWYPKYMEAQSAVRLGQVGRPFAEGNMTFGEAMDRLIKDGVDPAVASAELTKMQAKVQQASAKGDGE